MLTAFRTMELSTRLYGAVWVLIALAMLITVGLAAADAIPIDTWDEWSEARIAEVESGNLETAQSMEIEYTVNDDGSRSITGMSLVNVKEWRNLLVVPVLQAVLAAVALLLVTVAYFSGVSIGEHIHALSVTRLVSLALSPLGLVLALMLPSGFMAISAVGAGLFIWSWLIGADWHDASLARSREDLRL